MYTRHKANGSIALEYSQDFCLYQRKTWKRITFLHFKWNLSTGTSIGQSKRNWTRLKKFEYLSNLNLASIPFKVVAFCIYTVILSLYQIRIEIGLEFN